MNTLYIALICLAVFAGGAGAIFLAKKFGLTLINVPLAIVIAIKSALEGTSLAASKFSLVINLIIEALTYGSILSSEDTDTEGKVEAGLNYIHNICTQLDIEINETEDKIIRYVLSIGFTLMKSLNVGIKYNKLYIRMARYAGISEYDKNVGSARVQIAVANLTRGEQ